MQKTTQILFLAPSVLGPQAPTQQNSQSTITNEAISKSLVSTINSTWVPYYHAQLFSCVQTKGQRRKSCLIFQRSSFFLGITPAQSRLMQSLTGHGETDRRDADKQHSQTLTLKCKKSHHQKYDSSYSSSSSSSSSASASTSDDHLLSLPPPPRNPNLLYDTFRFILNNTAFASHLYSKYGPVVNGYIAGKKGYNLLGPEGASFVFKDTQDVFLSAGGWPDSFPILLGNTSLFLKNGTEYIQMKKLIVLAFSKDMIRKVYFEGIKAEANKTLTKWLVDTEDGLRIRNNIESQDWFEEWKKFTFAIACDLLVGVNDLHQDNNSNSQGNASAVDYEQTRLLFQACTAGLFTLPIDFPFTTWHKALRARDELDRILERVIEIKIHNLDIASPSQPQTHATDSITTNTTTTATAHPSYPARYQADALTLLIQSVDEKTGDRMSIQELKDQTNLLIFAGYETTSSFLNSVSMQLARYPQVMEKARNEQLHIMKKYGLDPEDDFPFEHLADMSYLDMVLKEHRCKVPFERWGKMWSLTDIDSKQADSYQLLSAQFI